LAHSSGRGLDPLNSGGTLQLSTRCSSIHFVPRRSLPVRFPARGEVDLPGADWVGPGTTSSATAALRTLSSATEKTKRKVRKNMRAFYFGRKEISLHRRGCAIHLKIRRRFAKPRCILRIVDRAVQPGARQARLKSRSEYSARKAPALNADNRRLFRESE
jgi:hypothetical protein